MKNGIYYFYNTETFQIFGPHDSREDALEEALKHSSRSHGEFSVVPSTQLDMVKDEQIKNRMSGMQNEIDDLSLKIQTIEFSIAEFTTKKSWF